MTNEYIYYIAHVCLTDGSVQIRRVEDSAACRYLGGRGMGMHLLKGNADVHPLMFVTGPLTDFAVPPGGRFCAVTRAADTNLPVSLSSGSAWGRMLKRAGLDGIVVEGQSPEWTYLSIENGAVRLHSARFLVGMDSGETARALKSVHGPDSTVLCIGPAGENLVPMAAVLCDAERAFSRAGIGKIMGAKKLKAIVVRAENAGDIPENACACCTIPCRNTHGGKNAAFSSLCNAYGLDSVGAEQVIAAIGELHRCGLAEHADAARWIRQISHPDTPFAKLAGEGLAALQRTYGADLLPSPLKQARERVKRNVTEEMAAVMDSLGSCLFASSVFGPEAYAQMLCEAAGIACTTEELLQIGAEILSLEV